MRPPQPVGAYTYRGMFYKGDAMSNVPTITPGPDDTGRVPEGATEKLPFITSAVVSRKLV